MATLVSRPQASGSPRSAARRLASKRCPPPLRHAGRTDGQRTQHEDDARRMTDREATSARHRSSADRARRAQRRDTMRACSALVRLVHPAPAAAVVALSAALGGDPEPRRPALPRSAPASSSTALSVAGSQIVTGAMNDWADRTATPWPSRRSRSPRARSRPPPRSGLAGVGLVHPGRGVPAARPAGAACSGSPLSASAVAYDLWLSRTAASFVPYLVSFGLLPLWIAAGVGVPLERVALAPLIVGPFAVAAHLANTLRDFDGDAGDRLGQPGAAPRAAAGVERWRSALAIGRRARAGIGSGVDGRLGAPSVAARRRRPGRRGPGLGQRRVGSGAGCSSPRSAGRRPGRSRRLRLSAAAPRMLAGSNEVRALIRRPRARTDESRDRQHAANRESARDDRRGSRPNVQARRRASRSGRSLAASRRRSAASRLTSYRLIADRTVRWCRRAPSPRHRSPR